MSPVTIQRGSPMVSKYHNVRVSSPDGKFDSKREYARWLVLKALASTGKIADLHRQVRFPIVVSGRKVCDYVADFVYVADGVQTVEDVKGVRTPIYRLKAKLMLACHGVEIREV